jgi:hypothetical protein
MMRIKMPETCWAKDTEYTSFVASSWFFPLPKYATSWNKIDYPHNEQYYV